MTGFFKEISKKRILLGFFSAALLVFFIGVIGILNILNISSTIEKIESEVVEEIIILEEVKNSFAITLLEMTTLLVLDFQSEEALETQIKTAINYWDEFEDGIKSYNDSISIRQGESFYVHEDEAQELVRTIIDSKRKGMTTEEILPYKKQLKNLEVNTVFPLIDEKIDETIESFNIERQRQTSTINQAFVLILFSSFLSILLIIFFGMRIVRREMLGNQFREQLISIASHQLKAPITIIKGNAETLLDGELSPENKKSVEDIQNSAISMGLLVKDLLDVSQIDQDRFDFDKKSINISFLLMDMARSLGILAKTNDVKIQFNEPKEDIFIMTDELKIRQAIQNVLTNGIKYNKNGGNLSLKLKVKQKILLLSVKDEGIGISRSEQGMIFERFFRTSNAKSKAEFGTGLGLFITRKIIEQSGGDIRFESEEGKGTTFYITLPIEKIINKKS